MWTDGLIQHFQGVKFKRERNLASYRWQGLSQFNLQAIIADSWIFFSSIKLIFLRKLAFQWVWSSQITFPLLGIPFQIKIQGTTHWTCCSQSIQEKPSPSAQFAIYVCQHHLLGKGQGRRKSFHRSACECPTRGTHRYWNNSFQHCQLLAQADDPLLFWALCLDKRLKMLN